MLVALLVAAVLPLPPVKAFGDWAVACDNARVCEMTSLTPEGDAVTDPNGSLSVQRDPGPSGGFTVEMDADRDLSGSYRIAVDGKPLEAATARGISVTFTGPAAQRIVAAMLNGTRAELLDARGTAIVRISLAGSSAALRYVDAEQGRAGSVTAAAARGSRPPSVVPVPPALPTISYIRPGGAAAALPAGLRARLGKESKCDIAYEAGGPPRPEVERFALGGGQTLVLIPCGAGAYNYSTVGYVLSGGKATPAAYDHDPGFYEHGPPSLINAEWDPATARLTSYSKGRGLGDCGSSASYVWDGKRFRLVEARVMGECRGSINWLRVWYAHTVAR